MPKSMAASFYEANQTIDTTKNDAERRAVEFTSDTPRDQVMQLHQRMKAYSTTLVTARDVPGMSDYAKEEWGKATLDWPTTIQGIITAIANVTGWIEGNFPTVRSTLNAAMTTAAIPPAQQDGIRAAMGANLDYLLAHKPLAGEIVSPIIPATALAPLVTLLNTLATAATI